MDANSRTDLHKQHVLALPKLQVRHSVLEYVKSQTTFSKAHATEGRAYMASWNNKEVAAASTTQRAPHPPRDIGFATPVLKPRAPRIQDPKMQRQTPDITNAIQTDSQSRRANRSSKAGAQEKPTRAPPSKEPRKRKAIPKRTQNIQSDEENRLQERRDRKRAKREIVQPGRSLIKKGGGNRDSEGQPVSKSKSSKTRLPAGLALMHGFAATNVGKHRLTIDPPIRPGVFGKGKASAPTRVGESTNKGHGANRVFSEEQFLKSAARIELTSNPPESRSSQVSSERAADRSRSPCLVKLREPCTRVSTLQPDTETTISNEKSAAKPVSPTSKDHQQPPDEARSVIWDIERDNGVLPSDSSSLGPGHKPSTVLLNVARQKPIIDSPTARTELASQRKPLDGRPVSPGTCTRSSHRAAQAGSPSDISSVRPSESPSQVIIVGQRDSIPEPGPTWMRSKYFGVRSPPRLPESEKEPVAAQPLGVITLSTHESSNDGLEMRPQAEDELRPHDISYDSLGLELIPSSGEDAIYLTPWHGDSADWLFGDPNIPDNFSGQSKNDVRLLAEDVPGPKLPCDGDQSQDAIPFSLWKPDCHGTWGSFEGIFLHGIQTCGGTSENDEYIFTGQEFPGPFHTDSVDQPATRPPFDSLSEEHHDLDPTLNEVASNAFSYEQGLNESVNDEQNSTASLILFNEGRKLLLGYTDCTGQPTHWKSANSVIESIEADVAKHLVGHWIPQKY